MQTAAWQRIYDCSMDLRHEKYQVAGILSDQNWDISSGVHKISIMVAFLVLPEN